jgi:hypothetical protein
MIHGFLNLCLKTIIRGYVELLLNRPHRNLDLEKFQGNGVYMIFYNGLFYGKKINRPIYVGKSVPYGWRNGKNSSKEQVNLWRRLKEHFNNLSQIENLDINDFSCKYLVIDSDIIQIMESQLIREYKPLWNCVIDGFGNHHCGNSRMGQKKPYFDILHPGRVWSTNMVECQTQEYLLELAKNHLDKYS